MPTCFSAWNAVLNKSVNMHFRHSKNIKHNGTRLVKILLFYSLIMSFSCATCMSTLGFCIIILYYKACTKDFPLLLCTTKLAQSTSQHYFVLQSLHKARFQYYFVLQACSKHFPALLCTTKFAQSPSQYYFVLQSLHRARSITTLYYKSLHKTGYISKLQSSYAFLLKARLLRNTLPQGTTIFS